MKIGFYEYIKEYIINFDCRPTLAALLLCLFLFKQGTAHGFMQTPVKAGLSLSITNLNIPASLTLLEKKAGYAINYNRSIFNEKEKINLEVKNMPVDQVLKKILAGTRVAFRFADANTILLYKMADPVKPGRISGKVFDEKGETLPGASIKITETGKATQTASDGSYILIAEPGKYTLEISYISFYTQRISDVEVKADKSTPLNIALKPDAKGLQEVIVTASYKKASVEGLLARQKNASEISNGISADQIARTPDKNIGESLKRISGVSSIDNKFVIVRGIGERYNSAQLDGVTLPSTEAQTRNFSFDLIPSNLVDNVVVSKSVTPDMNTSFGGGLIQINTKDIPTENFMSFTAGTSYIDQSTGKDFLSHKRGKYDYFGFDDGRRDYPEGLEHTVKTIAPNTSLTDAAYQKKVVDQSKRFTNDNVSVYKYKAAPAQNYQFTIGRLIGLDTANHNKFGFTGALSYRNTQNINLIENQNRSDWNIAYPNNNGASYGFNTTLGGILNLGLQLGKNRFSFRNTYTHLYDNAMVRVTGFNKDESDFSLPPNRIQETEDPTYTDLFQHKLSGQHQLGQVKIDWDIARTSIRREEKDLVVASSSPKLIGNEYLYFYGYNLSTQIEIMPMSRHHYQNEEGHYSWNLSATVPFKFKEIRSSLKTGYFGNRKKGEFNWQIASFSGSNTLADSLKYIPVSQMINPDNMGFDRYFYSVTPLFLDNYEGKSYTQAGYIMLDNRLLSNLRLVWGVRAEYYSYKEIKNGFSNAIGQTGFSLKPDRKWQWLPSANITYSPVNAINIRAAISSSVIRPELLDNSGFFRYSPYLDGQFGNQGLYSTRIDSYDFKTEWFPGLGEIISIGGYYKYFDKPAEITVNSASGNYTYYTKSSDWAKVYGLEFEFRKNLDFIADLTFLSRLTAYGNLTLQRSEVTSTYSITDPANPAGPNIQAPVKQKRAMYGQSPYQFNAGIQYTDKHFSFNIAYNKSGYKTYLVGDKPIDVEYEQARDQIDAQLGYKFLKNRFEIKLNAGNLLNTASMFYRNTASYEANPDYVFDGIDTSNMMRLKSGFSNKYDDGDQITFKQKFGRTYSTSITYNF